MNKGLSVMNKTLPTMSKVLSITCQVLSTMSKSPISNEESTGEDKQIKMNNEDKDKLTAYQ